MSEDPLQLLYQEILLDHNKRPRHYGLLDQHTHYAEGVTSLCGDQLELTLQIEEEKISAISFEASACAICKASTSILAEALLGRSLDDARAIQARAIDLLEGAQDPDPQKDGDFVALAGVSRFPARIKCATLPRHTFQSAIKRGFAPADGNVSAPDK